MSSKSLFGISILFRKISLPVSQPTQPAGCETRVLLCHPTRQRFFLLVLTSVSFSKQNFARPFCVERSCWTKANARHPQGKHDEMKPTGSRGGGLFPMAASRQHNGLVMSREPLSHAGAIARFVKRKSGMDDALIFCMI